MTKGYWQVPVEPNTRPKTAFITPFGKYQFVVMPLGVPAVFQRLMNNILTGLEGFAVAYMDDLVIFSQTWEDHLEHLEIVFGRLQGACLTVKKAKCQLGRREYVYLGHVVGQGRVKPETAKVEAIRKFETPKTKKDVRSFLRLAGYYRRFTPAFSETAAPLSDLTKKEAPNEVTGHAHTRKLLRS